MTKTKIYFEIIILDEPKFYARGIQTQHAYFLTLRKIGAALNVFYYDEVLLKFLQQYSIKHEKH
jgi:hypothetical protein